MREWNLGSGHPISLTLAADARLTKPDYLDDQIWEFVPGGGDPPSLALQTTYGLRARSFRLFPRFVEGNIISINPANFPRPPSVLRFYTNLLVVRYSPLEEIDIEAEYWVPQSDAIGGRLNITNNSRISRQVRFEWIAQLTATEGGQRMAPLEMQAAQVLCGLTGNLSPIVFLTGGPIAVSGPYPALTLYLEIPPGSTRQLIWSVAALSSGEESFGLARNIASRNWDAELARIELLNASWIEIITGDPGWDLAFALTQKVAYGLFLGPTSNLPYPSFVNNRLPDQGYSLRGDGSDYGHLWNGQSPLETYYLTRLITNSAPELSKGLLKNYLAVQTGDGFIDWKPGLAGQRGNCLAPPLLATMAWHIYQATEDLNFLEEVFPRLLNFFHAWFQPAQDRDGDGIPEWDHPMQAGLDDHPIFARWHTWAAGVDISTVESPSLCAFLYRECQTLIHIAALLDLPDPVPALQALADNLRIAVEISWDASSAIYRYWDRDSHAHTVGKRLGERNGSGVITLQHEFDQPARLVVRILAHGETTRRPRIFIHGISASEKHRIERLSSERFTWYMGLGTATSEHTYLALEYIEIQGLEGTDRVFLESPPLDQWDQSLLLPLWAGISSKEKANALVTNTITNHHHFWRPYGIPVCPQPHPNPEAKVCENINLIWNSLIGEGLLAYGFRAEAAELVTRLMNVVLKTLKGEGVFRRYYDAETGLGSGDRDALGGLAPMGLFLDVLGVRILSPYQVTLEGLNPFPWPVTVKYRGLIILRQKEKTLIVFPNGQTITIDDPSPRTIKME